MSFLGDSKSFQRSAGFKSSGAPGLFGFLGHLLSIMTAGDRLLFFLLLSISILSIFTVRLFQRPGQTVSVFVANRLIQRWPLAADGNHAIAGRLGQVQLGIHNRSIRVLHSRCPEQICVRQGAISRRGEIIVCVPNQMVVTIDGGKENAFDAVTP